MSGEEERRLVGEQLIELAQKSNRLKLVRAEVSLWVRRLQDLAHSLERGWSLSGADQQEALKEFPRLAALLQEQAALEARVRELEKLRDGL